MIASLSLKHRANKNQRQRIIAMVASPLSESAKDLEALGKKLKKNQIAIDIVNLGEPSNNEKLNALIEAAIIEGNSHYINVEPSITLLPDILQSSAILGRAYGGMETMGMDAGLDDDTQVAIRISLEEEQRRIEALRQQQAAQAGQTGATSQPVPEPMNTEVIKEREPTELEKDLLRKAKEGQASSPTGEEAKLMEDTEFLKDILKDLNVDPETEDGKNMIESIKKKKADEEGDKKQ